MVIAINIGDGFYRRPDSDSIQWQVMMVLMLVIVVMTLLSGEMVATMEMIWW